MRWTVCSVFDTAAQLYGRPVFVHSAGQAVRAFQDQVNSGEGDMAKHPGDFLMYLVGYFDDNAGTFEPLQPTLMARGADVQLSDSTPR